MSRAVDGEVGCTRPGMIYRGNCVVAPVSSGSVALVGLVVLLASSVPFVPTGEVVSGAAALTQSVPWLLVVLAVVVAASVAGDAVMLLGVRALARLSRRRSTGEPTGDSAGEQTGPTGLRGRVDAWLRRLGGTVRDNAFTSVVTGRLVPGGRAPVIVALALERYPLHRFVGADLVACTAWAGVYVALGALGGRVSGHPLVGTAVAVAAAVALGAGMQLVGAQRRAHARRTAQEAQEAPEAPEAPEAQGVELTAPGGTRSPVR